MKYVSYLVLVGMTFLALACGKSQEEAKIENLEQRLSGTQQREADYNRIFKDAIQTMENSELLITEGYRRTLSNRKDFLQSQMSKLSNMKRFGNDGPDADESIFKSKQVCEQALKANEQADLHLSRFLSLARDSFVLKGNEGSAEFSQKLTEGEQVHAKLMVALADCSLLEKQVEQSVAMTDKICQETSMAIIKRIQDSALKILTIEVKPPLIERILK